MSGSISLPTPLYEQAKQTARRNQQTVDEYVAQLVSQAIATLDQMPLAGDETLDKEAQAWIDLHPMLKEKYLGQYVALYRGRIIDMDSDPLLLNRRVRQIYPNEPVWISQVREKPFREIHMRSPRIER